MPLTRTHFHHPSWDHEAFKSSLSVRSLSLPIRPKSKRKERRVLSNSRSPVSYRHHQRQPCDAPSHTQLGHQSSCWSQKKPGDFKQQPPNCFYSLSNLITILMRNHPDRSGLRLTVTDRFPKVSRGLFAPLIINRRCQRSIHPERRFGNPKTRHPTGKLKILSPALHGVQTGPFHMHKSLPLVDL